MKPTGLPDRQQDILTEARKEKYPGESGKKLAGAPLLWYTGLAKKSFEYGGKSHNAVSPGNKNRERGSRLWRHAPRGKEMRDTTHNTNRNNGEDR